MRTNWITMILCGLLVGCAPQDGHLAGTAPPTIRDRASFQPWITPEQAVMLAAASPDGVTGTFQLVVRASGRQDGNLYLNSEIDYRDPRNISIDISDALVPILSSRFGAPVETHLAGRTILVTGTARKTRIDFIAHGRTTGKYYYQTHVVLRDPGQLTVLDDPPEGR